MRDDLRTHVFSPLAFIQVVILSILIVLTLIFTTTLGPALISKIASSSLEPLNIKGVSGTLLTDLNVKSLQWKTPTTTIEIEKLKLSKPRFDAGNNRLYSPETSIDRLVIRLPKSDNKPSEKITSLPDFGLPLNIKMNQLKLGSFEIIREGRTLFEIKNAQIINPNIEDGFLTANSFDAQPIIIGSPLNINLQNVVMNMNQPHDMKAQGKATFSQPVIGNAKANFTLGGTLTAYTFKASAELDNKHASKQNIQLTGAGDYDQVIFSQLVSNSADGKVSGKAAVQWVPSIQWSFDGSANQVKLARYVPDWPAQFDTTLSYKGGLQGDSIFGEARIQSLNGNLQGKKITASGIIEHKDAELNVDNLLAQLGNNKVKANGRASAPFDLSWDVNASNLEQILPQLSGQLTAAGTLKGSIDNPQLNAKLKANNIAYQKYKLGSANLVAQTNQGIYSLKGDLQNLDLEQQKISKANIDASGKIDNHKVKLDLRHSDGNVNLLASGGWKNQQWQGTLQQLQLDTKQVSKWNLQKPVQITASKNNVTTSKICLASRKANACSAVNWSSSKGVDIEGNLDRTPLALLNPFLPKTIQLKGSINGRYKIRQVNGKPVGEADIQLPASSVLLGEGKAKQTLDYQSLNVKAVFNGNKVTANTKLLLKNKGKLDADAVINLDDKGSNHQIDVNGKLSRIPLLMAKPWLPNTIKLQGFANGSFKLKQNGGKTTGDVAIQLPGSTVGVIDGKKVTNIAYQSASLNASINDKNITASTKLQLKNRGSLSASAKIRLAENSKNNTIDAQGKLNNIPLVMAKPWLPSNIKLNGNTNGSFKLKQSGGKTTGDVSIQLPGNTIAIIDGKKVTNIAYQSASLNASINDKTIIANTKLQLKNRGSLSADAKIRLAENSKYNTIDAQGKLNNIPLVMAKPWLPDNLKLNGNMNGSFNLKQSQGKTSGNAAIQLPNNQLVFIDGDGTANSFTYQNASLKASINNKTIITSANLLLKDRGSLKADANITLGANSNAHRIKGQASFNMPNISWLQPFIPKTTNLRGRVVSNITFSGRLLSPKITGQVALDQASIRLPEVGTNLRNISFNIRANDANRAIISGSVTSGQGVANLSGYISLRDLRKLNAEMKISGKNLQFINTHEARALMDPDLTIKATPQSVSILGKIHIPNAQITLNAIPELSVDESEDVIVIGEKKPDGNYSAVKIHPNITVSLGNNVKFKGFGLDTKLAGVVRVTHNNQDILTQGSVKINEGKYEAYGQDLAINDGRLVFNGPPSRIGMDVKAVRVIDDIQAGIHLTGTLRNPRTQLFSTPTLSESNILSYLLTGQSINDVTGSQTALLMQAVRSLNVVNGDGLMRNIGNSLGLDDLSFVANDDLKKSELRLGKKLGSRLYVRYIVGVFDSMQKIALDYKINKYLNLEAQAGADAQGMDLIYKVETD